MHITYEFVEPGFGKIKFEKLGKYKNMEETKTWPKQKNCTAPQPLQIFCHMRFKKPLKQLLDLQWIGFFEVDGHLWCGERPLNTFTTTIIQAIIDWGLRLKVFQCIPEFIYWVVSTGLQRILNPPQVKNKKMKPDRFTVRRSTPSTNSQQFGYWSEWKLCGCCGAVPA